MTIYDYMKMHEGNGLDVDTYDVEYDAGVTICIDADMEDSEDSYDRFCIGLVKLVEIDKVSSNAFTCKWFTCKWSKLIEDNMELFKAFSLEHWIEQYEDDEEEFIYQWIRELDAYLAGYVGESTYYLFCNDVINKIGA